MWKLTIEAYLFIPKTFQLWENSGLKNVNNKLSQVHFVIPLITNLNKELIHNTFVYYFDSQHMICDCMCKNRQISLI